MELLVNPASYSNALALIELGVHQICIGTPKWSARNNCAITLEQINELVNAKKHTKILVLVNRFYFENEIEELTNYIKEVTKLNIDGLIFTDMSINQICYEENIKIPLIYNPETLVTNYDQFPFYLDNNINEVALARELNAKEIHEIGANKNNMKVQMQVAGYAYVMHSRWQLVTNFQKANNIKDDLTKQKLLFRELSRKDSMIIYEDEHGSHILTNYSLNMLEQLFELHQSKIDTIRIDSFLHDDKWTLQTTKVYLDAINAINNNQFNSEFIKDAKQSLPNEDLSSSGFYHMDNKDLIYLAKAGVYE